MAKTSDFDSENPGSNPGAAATDFPWGDCEKFLPYRDHHGSWQWMPRFTQRRPVWTERGWHFAYREREPTVQELIDLAL